MDDGHILSLATISLAIILFFVLTLGGVMIYVFFRRPDLQSDLVPEKNKESQAYEKKSQRKCI